MPKELQDAIRALEEENNNKKRKLEEEEEDQEHKHKLANTEEEPTEYALIKKKSANLTNNSLTLRYQLYQVHRRRCDVAATSYARRRRRGGKPRNDGGSR
jgi:predicted transposase YbfD/YdcC